jgi:hypothetical protein
MKRVITIVLTVVIAATGLAAPGVSAQTEQQQQPVLTVQQVLVPKSRSLLLSKGVFVTASCTPGCLLTVQLQVSPAVASKLGLKSRVVGTAAVSAPDNVAITIRARIKRSARKALEGLRGSGRLQIGITALP